MFKRKKGNLKLNNSGSTLVLAMATIAFVSLIAFTVLAAASANLAMKRAQVYSNRAFYTAETAVDEVYTGLGVKAMNILNDAFEETSSNLLLTDATSGLQYMVSNTTANSNMRVNFIKLMKKAITNIDYSDAGFSATELASAQVSAKAYLQSCIKNVSTANTEQDTADIQIKSIGNISSSADTTFYVLLKDVTISYRAGNDYFSEITTDIQLEYPNMTINFTEETDLTDYLYFTLIADQDIAFSATSASTMNVASSIFAGKNINIKDGSTVNMIGPDDARFVTGDKVPAFEKADSRINVVAKENLMLYKDTVVSALTTDIFGKNVKLANINKAGNGGSNVKLNTDSNSNIYVEDDLEVNASSSVATIEGSYYGYSDKSTAANNSSAILMNGINSSLTMRLNNFILAGHAYVDIDSKASTPVAFAMGESVAAKGDQDAYLVLDKYFSVDNAALISAGITSITNPMSGTTWTNIKAALGKSDDQEALDIITSSLKPGITDFFAKDSLATDHQAVIKVLAHDPGGFEVYIYYNFKDSAAVEQYAKDLLSGNDLYKDNESYLAERNIISKNMSYVGTGISIAKADGTAGQWYVNATLLDNASGTTTSAGGTANSIDEAGFGKIKTDLTIRRFLMNHFLTTIPKTTQLQYGSQAQEAIRVYKNGANITLDQTTVENDTTSEEEGGARATAFEYILENPLTPAHGTGIKGFYKCGVSNNVYQLVVADTSVIVNKSGIVVDGTSTYTKTDTSKPTYGVIICYGNSVTVSDDFVGLILCKGNINVVNNANVYTNQKEILEAIENNTCGFEKNFAAFNKSVVSGGTNAIELKNLGYDDLVSMVNWRK